MKHILVFLSFAFAGLIFFNACREEAKNPTDTHISGTIHISVDESFAPIMRELGKIFQGNFPKAKIDMAFKSEAACLQDLFKDSTRMIFLARDLDSIEREMLKQKQIPITAHKAFARDAIAFVVAKSNVPYQMSQRQLEDLCAGKLIGKQLVFERGQQYL
jgi:phosphate transport system substrate-binding protein